MCSVSQTISSVSEVSGVTFWAKSVVCVEVDAAVEESGDIAAAGAFVNVLEGSQCISAGGRSGLCSGDFVFGNFERIPVRDFFAIRASSAAKELSIRS
jgi:hypothetical protein